MKKFLGMILIAGALVSCDNSGSKTEGEDTVAAATGADTSAAAATPTISAPDTAGAAGADTTTHSADTTKH